VIADTRQILTGVFNLVVALWVWFSAGMQASQTGQVRMSIPLQKWFPAMENCKQMILNCKLLGFGFSVGFKRDSLSDQLPSAAVLCQEGLTGKRR
jgi:hypothetical protein